MSTSIQIRKASFPADSEACREICCRTASSGKPIATDRWPFFGRQWIGPYERLLPDWTWVATADEKVVGYLTGCPDTSDFESRKFWRFDAGLLLQIVLAKYERNGDTRRYWRRTLGLEPWPNDRFGKDFLTRLYRDYPAHLHINVLEEFRKAGTGRMLVDAYFQKLRDVRCPGLHLFCGPLPIPFYQRIGMEILGEIDFTPTVKVYCMGIRLT